MTGKKGIFEKIIFGICLFFTFCFFTVSDVQAEEKAEFHVQTAEEMEDGTIRVSVYLNGISDLGGVEAELHYDPEKVSYVSSGIGNSFTDGIGVTNHVESESIIKCVLAFTSSKNAAGEMMYVIFKPNNIASYQPELVIKDIVDSSAEIISIPYTIQYQQSDGTWSNLEDGSEQKAKQTVIEEARREFAAKEDLEARNDVEGRATEAGKLENGNVDITEKSENKEEKQQGNDSDIAEEKGLSQTEKKQGNASFKKEAEQQEKTKDYRVAVLIGICVIICIVGIILWRSRKR